MGWSATRPFPWNGALVNVHLGMGESSFYMASHWRTSQCEHDNSKIAASKMVHLHQYTLLSNFGTHIHGAKRHHVHEKRSLLENLLRTAPHGSALFSADNNRTKWQSGVALAGNQMSRILAFYPYRETKITKARGGCPNY
ncbi:hypothetical protein AVEN_132803-1 [Araneus ventricosus]|uniref:Uncharacterized protein n=1 Tax=Araneus ventricosus TaxID=182803 RepID=A0A4Y2LP42_ARAVE|nr:hypothetical protein AVEN_132803-1 [Araneus ventricosus]